MAGERGVDLSAPPLPQTQTYAAFLVAIEKEPFALQAAVLYLIEKVLCPLTPRSVAVFVSSPHTCRPHPRPGVPGGVDARAGQGAGWILTTPLASIPAARSHTSYLTYLTYLTSPPLSWVGRGERPVRRLCEAGAWRYIPKYALRGPFHPYSCTPPPNSSPAPFLPSCMDSGVARRFGRTSTRWERWRRPRRPPGASRRLTGRRG